MKNSQTYVKHETFKAIENVKTLRQSTVPILAYYLTIKDG
jgi:hypothetical protein